jgi:hypothetical protein
MKEAKAEATSIYDIYVAAAATTETTTTTRRKEKQVTAAEAKEAMNNKKTEKELFLSAKAKDAEAQAAFEEATATGVSIAAAAKARKETKLAATKAKDAYQFKAFKASIVEIKTSIITNQLVPMAEKKAEESRIALNKAKMAASTAKEDYVKALTSSNGGSLHR